jgi:hypothetical protein
MTFQEAKDQIAREAGHASWLGVTLFNQDAQFEELEHKAAKLYATEGIKADRRSIYANRYEILFISEGTDGSCIPEMGDAWIEELPINLL